MKRTFLNLAIAAAFCATSLSAAPLKRADVSANPAWLLHIDFDAIRTTPAGQYILSEMDKPENQAKVAAFQSIFSFDLRTQLHGATLYGSTSHPEGGVLIVYANFDPERLTVLAKAAHDAQSTKHRKHEIRSWIDDKRKHRNEDEPWRIYASIAGQRVIFGHREETVAHALDVIDGSAKNLKESKEFANLGSSEESRPIEAAARKLDMSTSDPNASFLKFSKTAELIVGHKDDQMHARLTLTADDEEVAGHIYSIAQGIVALMKLDSSKPEAAKLASGLVIKQDGTRVTANLDLPSNEVVEMMKAAKARKSQKKKESDQ